MPSDGSQRQPRTFDRICSFEMCASNNTYFQHLDVHLHLARIYRYVSRCGVLAYDAKRVLLSLWQVAIVCRRKPNPNVETC